MPYISDDEEDQKNQDQNQSVQISGASPTTDATGEVGGGQGKKPLNTGSGYQNLDKYLTANSSQNFGGQLVDKVQGDVNTAKNNIDSASESFSNKVKGANYVPTSDQVNQAIANPTGTNAQDFQKWENQSYSGPTAIGGEDQNKLWSGTNDAKTKAGYLGTEPGRFTLLDSYYGKPSYSQGQKSLDNLLVQNQSGLGSQIQNVQSQANQLKGTAQNAQSSLQNQASTQAKAVQDSAASTRAAVGVDAAGNVITGDNAGALGKQYSDVGSQVAAANAQRLQQYNDLVGQLQHRGVSQRGDVMNVPEEFNLPSGPSYGDLSQYVTQGSDLTKDQVMTDDQRRYIQALSQLSGATDNFANGTSQGANSYYNFSDTGKAAVANAQQTYAAQQAQARAKEAADAQAAAEAKAKQDAIIQQGQLYDTLGLGGW